LIVTTADFLVKSILDEILLINNARTICGYQFNGSANATPVPNGATPQSIIYANSNAIFFFKIELLADIKFKW
jgi:hypothetical protein